ncbi:hypothetical protein OAory_01044960 [Aspergillus oryzae]|uniref:Uncharacterized protein n=3 Tax=Aspergillus oryzae TaxID=5062 RepID=A0A1S9DGC5_ASPOZ|nr:hypothetical protein OAory_01044960 [Aspergillus oryzae]
MKASTVLLCLFAAFAAATEGDPTVADETPTPTQSLRTVAPTRPIKLYDLTPEEQRFVFQYMRDHGFGPYPGTVMPGGWRWPDKRDGSLQPETEFNPDLSKLMHIMDTMPKPQGKINHYIGEKSKGKDDSNEDDEEDEDEDDGSDDEDTSPASPLGKRKQNPCKRGCRADVHCCPGDKCFYGVCLGPQIPPKESKREIYERDAPADEAQKSGEDDENGDEDDSADNADTSPASPLEKRKQNPCKRGCIADVHCCPKDKCFYGVCLGPHKPPKESKREIYERYAPADETQKSGEDGENVDGTRFEGQRDERCARYCENDSACCKSDKCVMGVCLGVGEFP